MESIVIFAIQEAIKYAPELVEGIKSLLNKTDATEADWLELRAKYLRKSYESVVKDSGLIPTELPPTEPTTQPTQ